ncbi:tetratricopeptide repeat protein [bacterium]|nr:tetratricopeptide repeat protein [bacterium]
MKTLLILAMTIFTMSAFSQNDSIERLPVGIEAEAREAVAPESALLESGGAKAKNSNYQGAIDDYTKALAINPKSTDAYYRRGGAKSVLKDYKGAINDFTKFIEIDSTVSWINWVYISRGLAHSALEGHVAAVADFIKAFDHLFKSESRDHFHRGELQPPDFEYHDRAWPSINQITRIQQSFKAVESKTDSGIHDKSDLVGKWVGDSFSDASSGNLRPGETLTFDNAGNFSSSWYRPMKQRYEVLYHANNTSIILIDTLANSKYLPYRYCVAKTGGKSGFGRKDQVDFRNKNRLALFSHVDDNEFNLYPAFVYTRTVPRPPEKVLTLSEVTDDRLNEAIKLFDKTFSMTKAKDQPLDLQKAIGTLKTRAGRLDTSVFKTAAYLDHLNPEGYLKASTIFVRNSRYNEAAFLFITGSMRYKLHEVTQGKYNVLPDMAGSDLIQNYLSADDDNFLFILQAAVDYCRNHDYGDYAQSDDPGAYGSQVSGYLWQIEQMKAVSEALKPIKDALKLLDIPLGKQDLETGQPSSELIRAAFNQGQDTDWDMDTWRSSVWKTADSLHQLGRTGQMDSRVVKAAGFLEQTDHFDIAAFILLENGRYNEAAFLYYVGLGMGTGRSRLDGGGWGFLVPLTMINTYLETDIGNFIHVREVAGDYCKNHNGSGKIIQKMEAGGFLQTVEDLKLIRDRQTPSKVALKLLGLDTLKNTGHFINYYNGGLEATRRSPLLYKQLYTGIVYNAVDSLLPMGRVGQMDKSVFDAARYLDQQDAYGYLTVSMILGENAKYNEAAFLMNLGMMRIAYQNSVTNRRGQKDERDRNDRQISESAHVFYRMIELYLGADPDNYIHVLQAALDYFRNNDDPAFPRAENAENYDKWIADMAEHIAKLETDRAKMSDDWKHQRISWEKESNPVHVKNESIIGSWSGKGEVRNTKQLVKFVIFEKGDMAIFPDKEVASYDNSNFPVMGDKKTTYTVDYSTTPIRIKVVGKSDEQDRWKNPSGSQQKTEYYIAEFFAENVLKFGTPYSNNPTKFIPGRSQILTRDMAEEKAFYNYERPKRTAPAVKISDKELERFWKDNIQAIIDLDKDKIMAQTSFPLEEGSDSARFREYGLDQTLDQKELRAALKDMDYKHIDQVQLDNEETGLMVYILGRTYYEIQDLESREQNIEKEKNEPLELSQFERHACFGFLFRKDGKIWKLNSISRTNQDEQSISGTIGEIKSGQDKLIRQAIVHIAKQSIESRNIQAIRNMNKDQILAQTNFPLLGNWGAAIGLKGDPSEWKKKDLKPHLDKFFSEAARLEIGYYGEDDGYGTKPLTFEYYASYAIQTNEEWSRYITRMKFGKVGKEWKMISLVWEAN